MSDISATLRVPMPFKVEDFLTPQESLELEHDKRDEVRSLVLDKARQMDLSERGSKPRGELGQDPIMLTEKEVQIYRMLKASGAIFPNKDPHAFREFVRCNLLDQGGANLQLTIDQWNTHSSIPDKEQYREPPEAAVDLALTAFILNKPLMLHDAWMTHQHGSLFARLRYYPPMEEFKTEWRDMVQAWLVIQGRSFPEMSKDIQKSFCMPEKQSYNNGVEYRFQVTPPKPVPPVRFLWIKQHADTIYWVGLAISVISMFIGLYWNTH